MSKTTNVRPAAQRLGDVLASLDATVLRVASAPEGLGPAVSDISILDRTDPGTVHEGAIVLGVGLAVDGDEAAALADRAGRAGAAALVLRSDGELPARLRDIAAEAQLALLAAPAEVSWGQLHALLRTASAEAALPRERDGAGVPIGDLFALADAVAAAIAAPVTIEDAHWRVLAYSNLDQPIDEPRRQTILGRTPPPRWQERLDEAGVAKALRAGDEIVRFEHKGLAPRLAAPVRAGSELLGSIWVAEGTTKLDQRAEEELARLARLAAVHLIAHRASDALRRRTRGAYVREALEGRVASGAGALSTRGPFSVLAFEQADQEHWDGDPERILSIVNLFAESLARDSMCVLLDGRFWALVPLSESRAREELTALAERVISRVEDVLGARLLASVGCPVASIAEVPRSRYTAEQALAVLVRRQPGSRVVYSEDVRVHAALLDLLDLAGERLGAGEGPVAELVERDRGQRSDYVSTLRAYLDCHGDVRRAAERLGVHPNTLRYRLTRVGELAGIDLDDPDERFMLELHLRLHEHRSGREV